MVNPFLTTSQASASLAQQYIDDEKASLMAGARLLRGYPADYGKSFDELKADALVEIQVERTRKEAQQRTAARLAGAEREGTLAALDEHATRVQPAPEEKEQRQVRRLQMCIDAGLKMPSSSHGRLPDGVGNLAIIEGVTRQSFSTDVKDALARKIERERPKPHLAMPKKP